MDKASALISSADNTSINKRKRLALAAAQMSTIFLQNLQQMDLVSTMAFIESSSDEDDDHVDEALLREIKALDNRN